VLSAITVSSPTVSRDVLSDSNSVANGSAPPMPVVPTAAAAAMSGNEALKAPLLNRAETEQDSPRRATHSALSSPQAGATEAEAEELYEDALDGGALQASASGQLQYPTLPY
jgi:hypothetical protein